MASIQCQKPVDHTKITTQPTHAPVKTQNTCNTCGYQKPAAQPTVNTKNNSNHTCHRKEKEHSFTNKMREMANSAYKKVADHMHHQDHHNNGHQPNPGPKPVNHGSGGVAMGKKKDSGMSNCIPRIGDHKKREKHSKKKGNDCKCKDGSSSSSSSSSSSESDNEGHVKRT